MAANRYSDKKIQAFLWILLPYTVGLISIVFGDCLYGSRETFARVFGFSALCLFLVYFVFGQVALLIQKRFPQDNALFKRIAVMLPVFYTMNVLMVSGLYALYALASVAACAPLPNNFLWAIAYGCFFSTLITFLNEAVGNWNKWKTSVTETEQLKNVYQKTKLLALKGQINPHFLFNCFNSLSSLISEDQEKAEEFLDEMTRVHRYMLRGDDDGLVPAQEELKFARSYLFLISVRFGGAITTDLHIHNNPEELCIPPLSLQVILENIIYTNAASKSSPLNILITVEETRLIISNNIQQRSKHGDNGMQEGLDNLMVKYRLLHTSEMQIQETGGQRHVSLPLIRSKKTAG